MCYQCSHGDHGFVAIWLLVDRIGLEATLLIPILFVLQSHDFASEIELSKMWRQTRGILLTDEQDSPMRLSPPLETVLRCEKQWIYQMLAFSGTWRYSKSSSSPYIEAPITFKRCLSPIPSLSLRYCELTGCVLRFIIEACSIIS